MAEYIADIRDIKFALLDQAEGAQLFSLPKYKALELDRETAEAILDEAYKFAKEQMGPANVVGDQEGATFSSDGGKVTLPKAFHDIYKTYCENGWLGLSYNAEYGGQGMPGSLHLAANDLFFGSCLSFCLGSLLTTGAGHLVEVFGVDELKKLYIEKMYTGAWAGTMCLTESGAGSDVGASRTRAKKEGDHYLIEGEKIFISFGEHDLTENIIHAVLARTEGAPAGSRGLSLFLVPKIRVNPDGSLGDANDVVCSGVEEKMGIHASPTCTMVFGAEGKCHGWLLGEENKGMRVMFQMMNEARINVGLQGVALANAAYQSALAYAKERIQGKNILEARDPAAKDTAIINHPDVRQMLMWQKAWSEGIRSLLTRTAVLRDMAEATEDPEKRASLEGLVDLLTPICKAYSTDIGFRSIELSLQTLGGYGYLREFGVEQYMRDIKIASIYEGTNGIQALDLVGRKLALNEGAAMRQLVGMMTRLIEEHAKHPALEAELELLGKARDALADVSMTFAVAAAKDPMTPILNATPYLDLFGQVVIGWLLLEQALIAHPRLVAICDKKSVDISDARVVAKLCSDDEDAKFYAGKVKVAQFYARRAFPQARGKAIALKSGDNSAMEIAL